MCDASEGEGNTGERPMREWLGGGEKEVICISVLARRAVDVSVSGECFGGRCRSVCLSVRRPFLQGKRKALCIGKVRAGADSRKVNDGKEKQDW